MIVCVAPVRTLIISIPASSKSTLIARSSLPVGAQAISV
jgi:hypothetical protein